MTKCLWSLIKFMKLNLTHFIRKFESWPRMWKVAKSIRTTNLCQQCDKCSRYKFSGDHQAVRNSIKLIVELISNYLLFFLDSSCYWPNRLLSKTGKTIRLARLARLARMAVQENIGKHWQDWQKHSAMTIKRFGMPSSSSWNQYQIICFSFFIPAATDPTNY